MTSKPTIHKPTPVPHLPEHERRAAAHRRHNEALPNIPGVRPTPAPKPRPVPANLAAHPAGHC